MPGGSRSTWSAPTGCRRRGTFNRYVVVDSGAAEAYLFDRDRVVGRDARRRRLAQDQDADDGRAHAQREGESLLERAARTDPQPDRKAGRKQGLSYLKNFHYEVLSDWTANATPVDPKKINWKQVAAGKRRHSRPPASRTVEFDGRHEVRDAERLWHLSARHAAQGAVRRRTTAGSATAACGLQDYRRFASWVFGDVPQPARRGSKLRAAAAGADLHDLSDGRAERQRRGVPPRPLWLRHAGDAADVRWRDQHCIRVSGWSGHQHRVDRFRQPCSG